MCITISAPGRASARAFLSVIDASTNSARLCGGRTSKTTGTSPRCTNIGHRICPRSPDPPVSTTRISTRTPCFGRSPFSEERHKPSNIRAKHSAVSIRQIEFRRLWAFQPATGTFNPMTQKRHFADPECSQAVRIVSASRATHLPHTKAKQYEDHHHVYQRSKRKNRR